MGHDSIIAMFGVTAMAAPLALFAVLGLPALVSCKPGEKMTGRACQVAILTGLLATLAVGLLMLVNATPQTSLRLGDWVVMPHYHLSFKLNFDSLSLAFALLSYVLCGLISAFATRYLHREPGYHRFFVLYALFVAGIVLTALAGTIETLFVGWEMVGLSSALLVAYFQERPAPVRNGLRVWVVYRVSDAALLLAAVVLHHLHGEGDFERLLGQSWPDGEAQLLPEHALLVGVLLLLAAAGKSALVPFSGWLPRAMEGPTPSSAIFYGALSVHLGAFLLLRVGPLLESSALLAVLVIAAGLLTAILAYLVGSVQTDIKSVLSYAALVQVGLIVAEIGAGLRYLALLHLIGHACLRTLQFLRAPTLLQDYHTLENALGQQLPRPVETWSKRLVPGLRSWVYRFALERAYLDVLLDRWLVGPFLDVCSACDRLERRWTSWLAGGRERESLPAASRWEELP